MTKNPHPARDAVWQLVHANRRAYDSPIASPRAVQDRITALEAALAIAERDGAMLRALEASTSWRITAPLRRLVDRLKGSPPAPEPPVPAEAPAPPPGYGEWIGAEPVGSTPPERGRRTICLPRLGLVLLCAKGVSLPASFAETQGICTVRVLHESEGELEHESARAIAAASALEVDLVCLLDARDRLAPGALEAVADTAARHPQLDLIFADEDWLDAEGTRVRPFLKPGWDGELQRGRDLVGPFAFFRTALVRAAQVQETPAWRYDLACQVAAATSSARIHRIARVLCHRSWDPPGHDAARIAVAAAQLAREGIAAEVVPVAGHPDWQRVVYALPQPAPLVSIIVPTRDHADLLRACAEGILHRTHYAALELLIVDNGTIETEALALLDELARDPRVRVLRQPGAFNWSALNNAGAAHARGDILLLLNNDIAVLHPGWLAELAAHALQPGVGAVGAKLLYPDGRVQHAGLTTDANTLPRHLLRFAPRDDAGPFGLLGLAREVWGVTGACLAIRRDMFSVVGGLNESFPIGCNDVDFCLRLRAHGTRIVWTPWAELEHRELATRGPDSTPERHERVREEIDRLVRDWGSMVADDPYLHPALDPADDRLAFRRAGWEREYP